MNNSISKDEKFVVEALCSSLGGIWCVGENPPDVYLKQGDTEIAVEISTLTQHVQGKNGVSEPRLSQDSGVLQICEELNNELRDYIQSNQYFILTIHAPIDKLRKFKKSLKKKLIDILNSENIEKTQIEISGTKVSVNLVTGDKPSGKKVVGLVPNENSTAHISSNAAFILNDRILKKTGKCSMVLHRPLWLALFNDYWLADPGTYKHEMQHISEDHPFEKIFIVTGNREVHLIYKT